MNWNLKKEKHLSSLPDQMSRLSFDTNVIQSLSKKVDEINASLKMVYQMFPERIGPISV
jgi:hypothetical protein